MFITGSRRDSFFSLAGRSLNKQMKPSVPRAPRPALIRRQVRFAGLPNDIRKIHRIM